MQTVRPINSPNLSCSSQLYSRCSVSDAKKEKPQVNMRLNGTMVTVLQHCIACKDPFMWSSQQYVFGRHPAGNILLSFAIPMAGASISKVALLCKHLGLCLYIVRTFLSSKEVSLSCSCSSLGRLQCLPGRLCQGHETVDLVRRWKI